MRLETHASPDASLASPLLFALHVLGRWFGIVAGAARFEFWRETFSVSDGLLASHVTKNWTDGNKQLPIF
jgi:hypothetical protein